MDAQTTLLGRQSASIVDGATFRRLCRSRDMIRDGHGEPLTLDAMASHAGLSRFPFLRAKELLRRGMTVTEACFEVGFSSVGSFSTLFAREVGRSPRAFQREAWRLVQVPGRVPMLVIPYCFIARIAPGADG